MENLANRISKRFRPGLVDASTPTRLLGAGDILSLLYTVPLTIVAWVWLYSITDFEVFVNEWPLLIAFLAWMFVFNRLSFFVIVEINEGAYANSDGSFVGMVTWIVAFLYGPTAVWLTVVWYTIEIGFNFFRSSTTTSSRWDLTRNYYLFQAGIILGTLIGLRLYQSIGGVYPLSNLDVHGILISLSAIIAAFGWLVVVYLGFGSYLLWVHTKTQEEASFRAVFRLLIMALGLPPLAHPFSILAAGLYSMNGWPVAMFFLSGFLVVAFLTRELSRIGETSRRQSRQLERLEQLSRAILNAPPDASTLPDILLAHVPTMFPSSRVAIWHADDEKFITVHPESWDPTVGNFWEWIRNQEDVVAFESGDAIPWRGDQPTDRPLVASQIKDTDTEEPFGAIYIELRNLAQPWHQRELVALFSAVRSLSAQIASAYRQAIVYEETLEHQKLTQELRLAGEIQSSFLPSEMPILPGWELAVTILPARETSGDFFDFIPLEDGRLGILIADVVDKGMGPALYMALSRTLIRTYAIEYEADPDVVFFATNERLFKDARANLFLTAFYGILDWETGVMVYSNAGHNTPYLLSQNGKKTQVLEITGMPIGIDEENVWRTERISFEPGDVLLMYTDGIPDAQNEDGHFFEQERLLETAKSFMGMSAQDLQMNIIRSVEDFVGTAPQFDDITLMILAKDFEEPEEDPED